MKVAKCIIYTYFCFCGFMGYIGMPLWAASKLLRSSYHQVTDGGILYAIPLALLAVVLYAVCCCVAAPLLTMCSTVFNKLEEK